MSIYDDLRDTATAQAYSSGDAFGVSVKPSVLLDLLAWHDKTLPIIAALAIYGEGVNVAALVAKAQTLNEAKPS